MPRIAMQSPDSPEDDSPTTTTTSFTSPDNTVRTQATRTSRLGGGFGGFTSDSTNTTLNNNFGSANNAAATTAAGGAESTVKLDKETQDWVNKKWRPMMGWMYMATCTFDFILAPILWSAIQMLGSGKVEMQWQPITLQGAGLYHIAMGAVLGIAAYGRTKEKLDGKV